MAEAKARREMPYHVAIERFKVHAMAEPQEREGGRALCGAKRPAHWGLRTDYRGRVTCPRCAELFTSKMPVIRPCIVCGVPLYKGDHNPCDKCNPNRSQAYARTHDEVTEYHTGATVLVGAHSTAYYAAPSTDGGSSHTSCSDSRLGPYLGYLHEGGWVIDKRRIMDGPRRGEFVDGVMNGPMIDTAVAPSQVDRCPQPSAILLGGLQGAFQTLAMVKTAKPEWRGLDSIGPEDYAAFWRERGAKVGRRRGDAIVWDDGSRSLIPAFASRWAPHEVDSPEAREPQWPAESTPEA